MSYQNGAVAALRTFGLEKTAVSVSRLLDGARRFGSRFLKPRIALTSAGPSGPELFQTQNAFQLSSPTATSQIPQNLQGKVQMPRGNVGSFLREDLAGYGFPQNFTPAGHRATNAWAMNHEMRELQVPRDQLRSFFSHASPRLVGQDRNLRRSLTGEGASEAQQAMSAMSRSTRDARGFDNLMGHYLGPRAVDTWGNNVVGAPKIPGRVIDEVSRRYARDMKDPALSRQLGRVINK